MTADDNSRFVQELTAAAQAVAAGEVEQVKPMRTDVADPELAELGRAFNEMLERVRRRRRQLEERDVAFRTALNRLGDALTLTHDRAGIVTARPNRSHRHRPTRH